MRLFKENKMHPFKMISIPELMEHDFDWTTFFYIQIKEMLDNKRDPVKSSFLMSTFLHQSMADFIWAYFFFIETPINAMACFCH